MMTSSYIDPSILTVFVPTFFLVSATPGMCMTLSMSLGMTIGLRRTLWMMWGELAGVAFVSLASVLGVAAVMLAYPTLFHVLKYCGGVYLGYLGIQMWRSQGRMALAETGTANRECGSLELVMQGLLTAVANPKGWAFMISLLPPFINPAQAIAPQMTVLLAIILSIEFCCLLIYAGGGKTLRAFLQRRGNVRLINRAAGTLMMVVAVWLIAG